MTMLSSSSPRLLLAGTELKEHRTYLRLDLVASHATFTFEVKILILIVLIGDKLSILHFHLITLKYGITQKII